MNGHREISKHISILQRIKGIYFAKRLCGYQIGYGQQFFLIQIAGNPGISLQELAFQGYYDKATATRAVKKLEEEGFVYTRTDARDKRIRRIYVTERALPVIEKTREILNAWNEMILDGFDSEEKEQAEMFLKRMAQNAHEHLERQRREE